MKEENDDLKNFSIVCSQNSRPNNINSQNFLEL